MRFIFAFLLLASLAEAQSKEPAISDATHAKIRDLQLQQKTVEANYLQAQAQLKQMENQYTSLGQQITKAMDEAYKEAGAKPEEYSLQPDTLKFVKVEKPKAEEKKK